MAHGGKRPGSGRKPGVKLPDVADHDCAGRLLEALNREEKSTDSYEVKQWRMLTEAGGEKAGPAELSVRFRSRAYLYDKRDGKAVQPLDFTRPIDVIIDLDSAVTRRAGKK